jgi:hypothetical protein
MKKFKRGSISTVTGFEDFSQLGGPKLIGRSLSHVIHMKLQHREMLLLLQVHQITGLMDL